MPENSKNKPEKPSNKNLPTYELRSKTTDSPKNTEYSLKPKAKVVHTPIGRGKGSTSKNPDKSGPNAMDNSEIQNSASSITSNTVKTVDFPPRRRKESIDEILNANMSKETQNSSYGSQGSQGSQNKILSVTENSEPQNDLATELNKIKLVINHLINEQSSTGAIPKIPKEMRRTSNIASKQETAKSNTVRVTADDELSSDIESDFQSFLRQRRKAKQQRNKTATSSSEELSDNKSVHSRVRVASSQRSSLTVRNEMDKWGLRFDNSHKSLPIKSFLFRVKTLKDAYGYDSDHVCKYFHLLLSGEPLNWYYQFLSTHRNITWKILKKEILERFRSNQNDLKISNKMQNLKQGKDSFEQFYNEICALNHSLDVPKTDEEIISILRENMDDGIRQRVFSCETSSLTKFLHLCNDAYEDVIKVRQARKDFYNNNKINRISEIDQFSVDDDINILEARLSKIRESKMKSLPNVRVNPILNIDELSIEEIDEIFNQTRSHKLRNNDRLTCFNCEKQGHGFVFCPEDKIGIFCYRCGKRDVKTIDCPKCSDLNGNRSEHQNGSSRS